MPQHICQPHTSHLVEHHPPRARLPTSHMHARIHDVHAWCICILHACMCTYECMPTPSSFSSSSRQRAAEPTSAALSAVLASERALARAWRG